MSPWDNLYVITTLGADQVLDVFLDCLPDEAKSGFQQSTNSAELATARVDSFTIDVRPVQKEYLLSAIEKLNIGLTIKLTFDSKNHFGHEYIYLATLKIIRTKGWDLVLTQSDGMIILTYIAGELTVKGNDFFLTPERLKMIDMPYKIADIP
jgi:hypothetical protein